MTIEVIAATIDELSMNDARHIENEQTEFFAVVISAHGPPFAGRVSFVSKPSGRGMHRVLKCPMCGEGRLVLVTDGKGAVGCKLCTKMRTRRQVERTNHSWTQLDGALEDSILRAIERGHGDVSKTLVRQIDDLHARDDARWQGLQRDVHRVLRVAGAR